MVDFIPIEWVEKWKSLSGDFCDRLRENTGRVDESGYSEDGIVDLADYYGISGIFYSRDDEHLNLIGKVEDDDVFVYDPFGTVYVYNVDSFEPDGIMKLTINLHEEISRTGYEFIPVLDTDSNTSRDYREVLRLAEAVGYNIDASGALGEMQGDNYNCGPLTLYAAIVGNANNPKYSEKLNWGALARDFGLTKRDLIFR